jgi:hypothetical protein
MHEEAIVPCLLKRSYGNGVSLILGHGLLHVLSHPEQARPPRADA